jgi:hypothetical protein
MVVDVGLLGVVLGLVLDLVLVAVGQRRVIVLVAVVVRSMLELVQQPTAVAMGHVIVIVSVHLGRMRVLLLASFLADRRLLSGRVLRRHVAIPGVVLT